MINRTLSKKIISITKGFPIITLTGPRQSGKTTLVRWLFPNYEYINLENLNDLYAVQEDPLRFLKAYSSTGVIIDEAQKLPELFSYLQGIVDESKQMGKFILTGSQNFLLLEKITQSLAGRVAVFHLMPFGLSELEQAGRTQESLDKTLFTGSYPVLYDRDIEPQDYYPSYIQTYIERDVRSIKNIGNLSTFQRFIKLCAGRTGQLINFSSIGNELGINYKTVSSWISILEASFIVYLLEPHYKNFSKRLVKQTKLYFFDTGLLCSLLNIQNPVQLNSHYLRGNIFESYIVTEYIKMRYHAGLVPNAFFWRDSTGHEIDLLLEEGENIKAIEIKSGETINSDFFKGLKYYGNLSALSKENLILIYGGLKNYRRSAAKVLSWKNLGEMAE
ncbi:MAG: ATP-binding protein [Desulfobacula sp.]|uniref:ATP-binding protein n=1 Tax=Desulfobacula sp. TaxID=2593537 RepID=UPI0025BA088E|nr:ATP-binding protein [Desulfobacula sp.]MCD4722623.1 ATP-binding protein [Desulfobacula sp.]